MQTRDIKMQKENNRGRGGRGLRGPEPRGRGFTPSSRSGERAGRGHAAASACPGNARDSRDARSRSVTDRKNPALRHVPGRESFFLI